MVEDGISGTVPDWSRESPIRFWHPSRQLLRTIRRYRYWRDRGRTWRWVAQIYKFTHLFWGIVTSAEIDLNCDIAGGLLIPHPNGIVIHPEARIGPNCLIFQQVTIGAGGGKPGLPTIQGHVDIGAGAKILGGVVIGKHSRIGANAVVVHDVPAYATAVGIPARIIPGEHRIVGPDLPEPSLSSDLTTRR